MNGQASGAADTMKLVFDIETIPHDESVTVEEENRQMYSLNKKYARVLCIGYLKMASGRIDKNVIAGDEPEVLSAFWDIAEGVDVLIGHNIFEFDLPIVTYRSSIHNVQPTHRFRFLSYRAECEHVYDTLLEAKKVYGRYVKLNELAGLLGIELPRFDLDGRKVYAYHKAGRDKEIHDYCAQQVELTLRMYDKMSFRE